jgi:hypothetical protein
LKELVSASCCLAAIRKKVLRDMSPIELVRGSMHGHTGTFLMQQFGTMHDGGQTPHYDVVPGSGKDGLAGLSGVCRLNIESDGTHRNELAYDL